MDVDRFKVCSQRSVQSVADVQFTVVMTATLPFTIVAAHCEHYNNLDHSGRQRDCVTVWGEHISKMTL